MAEERVIPRKDSRWQCPCGFEGSIGTVGGHRKGKAKRPQCRGKIKMVYAGSPDQPPLFAHAYPAQVEPSTPTMGPLAAKPPAAKAPTEPHPPLFEFIGAEPMPDPESLARLYNEQRLKVADALGSGLTPPDDGHNGDGLQIEPSPSPPQISMAREAVVLPVIARVMYDWAREQGWAQGDGSLSSFVTDMLLDHFRNCMGKAVVVVDREALDGS